MVHVHSGLRWLALLFIVVAIANAIFKQNRKSGSVAKTCVADKLTLIFMHLQLLIGFVLYFISPKVIFSAASMKSPVLRFFLVEHVALMLIAVVLITIGYVKSDRAIEVSKKYKYLIIYYSIALLLILVSIPWPFRGLGAAWF
jgi:hypothetical protein